MKVNERLLLKGVNGTITPKEFQRLDYRASAWPLCAVGEHRAALRKRGFTVAKESGPIQPVLSDLGERFAGEVATRHFRRALRLYTKIKQIAFGERKIKGGIY